MVRTQRDDGIRRLAPLLMGKHRRRRHHATRVRRPARSQPPAGQMLTRGDDPVLIAVGEEQVAVLVEVNPCRAQQGRRSARDPLGGWPRRSARCRASPSPPTHALPSPPPPSVRAAISRTSRWAAGCPPRRRSASVQFGVRAPGERQQRTQPRLVGEVVLGGQHGSAASLRSARNLGQMLTQSSSARSSVDLTIGAPTVEDGAPAREVGVRSRGS